MLRRACTGIGCIPRHKIRPPCLRWKTASEHGPISWKKPRKIRASVAAAITGSACVSAEREDRWSDIDLAFSVSNSSELKMVVSDWTALMYWQYLALHHLVVRYGEWIYLSISTSQHRCRSILHLLSATEFQALASTRSALCLEKPMKPARLSGRSLRKSLAWHGCARSMRGPALPGDNCGEQK